MKLRIKIASLALALATAFTATARAQMVDLELVLLVDVSGSVDSSEYALQKQGYVQAFQNAGIQSAIASGALGQIAVTYIEWSSAGQQSIEVGWTLINSAASANAFASAINSSTRNFSGSTGVASALTFGAGQFANSFTSTRQVIDISGDGADNEGGNTLAARNAALASGVDTINGIVILGEGGLQTFYQNNVVGGTNGFLEVADNFVDFSAAIDRKLIREIRDPGAVPEPSTYGLIGAVVLLGAVAYRRRKAAKVA
jgi:hypothetical protein